MPTTPYSCRSCSRSNRVAKFSTKTKLIEHKTSPDFVIGPRWDEKKLGVEVDYSLTNAVRCSGGDEKVVSPKGRRKCSHAMGNKKSRK